MVLGTVTSEFVAAVDPILFVGVLVDRKYQKYLCLKLFVTTMNGVKFRFY